LSLVAVYSLLALGFATRVQAQVERASRNQAANSAEDSEEEPFRLTSYDPEPDLTPPVKPDDVMARLHAAEERIKALEAQDTEHSSNIEEAGGLIAGLQKRWQEAQDPAVAIAEYQLDQKKKDNKKKAWYERLNMRGYTQFRINQSMFEDDDSAPAQHPGDRSIGDNQSFLIRRARLIIFGDVSDHMYVYLQPDFASNVPGSPDANHFAQIRDWYADCYVDTDQVHRFRVGQSKVPYGWENMQSSSNRIPLDRDDALNSAVRNERDLGIFYYYTPDYAQEFFKDVLEKGLKGSGNYGMFAFGCYNGQGGSFFEQNDNIHIITRLTVPWQCDDGQYIEASVQAYTGRYVVLSSPIPPLGVPPAARPAGTLENGGNKGIRDERIAATFVYYPQPWGLQAEWNWGRGPGLNDAQTVVEERALNGGYVQTMYKYDHPCYGTFFPYFRYQYYKGGYKPERNAPFSHINEFDFGLEWEMNKQMELTAEYVIAQRTNTTALNEPPTNPYGLYDGHILRFQFQFNY